MASGWDIGRCSSAQLRSAMPGRLAAEPRCQGPPSVWGTGRARGAQIAPPNTRRRPTPRVHPTACGLPRRASGHTVAFITMDRKLAAGRAANRASSCPGLVRRSWCATDTCRLTTARRFRRLAAHTAVNVVAAAKHDRPPSELVHARMRPFIGVEEGKWVAVVRPLAARNAVRSTSMLVMPTQTQSQLDIPKMTCAH